MAPAGATAGAGFPGAGAGMQGMSEQEQAMVKAVSHYTPELESSTWTRYSEREGQNMLTRTDARSYGILSREDCDLRYHGIRSWWCVWIVYG